jgi:hypothetical protein
VCKLFNIEIKLDDVCLDLLVVRKHVYNSNRLFKAADHIHVGCVNMYIVQYIREKVQEKERPLLLLHIYYKHIYLKRI